MDLPPQYTGYFAGVGPKEGGLSVEPGWFQLWPPDEVPQWNHEYQVHEFAPGFLGFGSSGGGELLAFDSESRIVMIPFIGMSAKEAKPVAASWGEFVEKIEP
ncbi:SMI1/KNR4 family protein [Prosthecobacter sp.]|uniref:SMI1/KNR4 family protein n=1 Tax=Prosthecobacter sp. TaxID=1965333 RepID=UPI0037842E51